MNIFLLNCKKYEKKKKVICLDNKEYDKLVKKVSPNTNVPVTCAKAFVFGGSICLIGEIIRQILLYFRLPDTQAATWTSIILVFLGALLTGIGVYDDLAKHGGAGTAVPITGFANSVASPAIEFKKEGQVFGIGCKIFTIAGPVILYGIFTSWVLGLIYWIGRCVGWF